MACSWDLTSAATKIHELHTAIRINKNCSANAIRITTADFIDAIPELYKCLTNRPLDSQWHVPRASVNAPWMDLVLDLRRSPFQLPSSLSCITELPLESWQDTSPQDIKSKLPGVPGPKSVLSRQRNEFLDSNPQCLLCSVLNSLAQLQHLIL